MTSAVHIPGIEIEAELGHGAYSAVYRARRGTTPCAVKVPRTRGKWTRWVYREAVALARVRHPGLPAVIEVGEVGDVPFLVMELVEGETLADKLHRGPLAQGEAVELVTRLVEALSAVHDAGLVHRDVKPRNIIMEPSGTLRLVDFGFAAPTDRAAGHDAAGTPGYTAPEQFHSPAQVDARADLYAVGQVLLECVTGRLPGSTREHEGPVRGGLTTADASRLSGPIGRVIAGLRAYDPRDRYPDAGSVLRELDLLRHGHSLCGPSAYEPTPRLAGLLIGRDLEVAQFRRAWDGLAALGGSLFVVEGPRGSGKTRLLRAFAAVARESGSGRILDAQCRDQDPPLAVLRRLLEAYLATVGRTPHGDRAADEAALRHAASDHLAGFATLIAPRLSTVLGPDTTSVEAAPGGFPEGAAELFARLARAAGPLLLCIDDVHWVDPISRQVLLRLAQRATGAPLLIAFSSRRRPSDPAPLAEIDSRVASRIDLRPLEERQVAALIASHLGDTALEPALARRIGALAGGTPLGVLEVLGAMLDLGAVRPREGGWVLDLARMESVALPDGSSALLGRRVTELSAATRRVLQIAALIGTAFEHELLASVVECDSDDLRDAIAEAGRAGILESEDRGAHRFVHDTAREILAGGVDEAERQNLHARIAESLRGDGTNLEAVCAAAAHYAASSLEHTAPQAHRAALAAAEVALRRFDNETALGFLDLARRAAGFAGIPLDTKFHRSVGEGRLRLGALEESLDAFAAALDNETDRRTRASIEGRVAWVQLARAEPDLAEGALARAFHAMGAHMPVESIASAAGTLWHVATRSRLPTGTPEEIAAARANNEILYDLHYQSARLGFEYGRRYRFIANATEARRVGLALGPSRALARARAYHGLVLTTLGLRRAGAEELARAERMASELGDPVTLARCLQARAVTAALACDTERSLELFRECLDTRGPWLELNEYCLNAATAELLESLRGKSSEAWAWIQRVVDRQERSYRPTVAFSQLFIHRVRACLAALGRRPEPGSWLASQIESLAHTPAPRRSYYRAIAWGARARIFVESGDLGSGFDALVREFEADGLKPRSAHPAIAEYYIAVAHGRIHQFLRSSTVERPSKLAAVERALADLRAMKRAPGQRLHALFCQAFVATFRGQAAVARRLLAEAQMLAEAEDCPWVLYAIARTRAHRLRDEGKLGAARDQARIAEMLAHEHGAEPRARWVREELGLSSSAHDGASLRPSTDRAPNASERQLAGVLRLLHAPELRPEQQAATMLDDLLRELDADRGLILFRPEASAGSRLLLGRDRRGDEWSEVETWRQEWLESVRESGRPWPPEEHGSSHIFGQTVDPKRLLAAPLVLGERSAGAICLERSAGAPAFTAEERELLMVLSRQMPVSLEIAELFVERDRLHASLRQAQKMETVGQIAGGIAHDFHNMLRAIEGSLQAIRDRSGLDPEVETETELIADVTQRAGRLMRQLLTYARQQGGERIRFTVNDRIGRLKPMLQRLAGERVAVVLELDPEVGHVTLGESAFDQAMVNLVMNARDAMPSGGTLTIATRDVVLDDAAARRGALSTGPHVHVEVNDTGQGISPEHVRQVFDPFFTTKPAGSGTGIGLTTVYAFVRNTGGHVEVTSTVGRGTTLSMFFPTEGARPVEQASGRARESAPSAASTAAGAPRLARTATPASR